MVSRARNWFSDVAFSAPIRHAATSILDSRSRLVNQALDRARREMHDQPESIHQLRVSTRRFGEALSIFKDLLAPELMRRVRRANATLRRETSDLRDVDVMGEMLKERIDRSPWLPEELTTFVNRRLEKKRKHAKSRLERDIDKLAGKLQRATSGMFEAMRAGAFTDCTDRAQSWGEWATSEIEGRKTTMLEAGSGDLLDGDKLHQLRLNTKRFRYRLELFAGALPPASLESFYDLVENMQEQLGRINDLRNLFEILADLRPQWRRARECSIEAGVRLYDRLTATVAAEWQAAQSRFAQHWESQVRHEFGRKCNAVLLPRGSFTHRPSRDIGRYSEAIPTAITPGND